MKPTLKLINIAKEQCSRELLEALNALMAVCYGLPVPVFEGKSSKQSTLDLAHSIVNAMIEHWLHHVLGWERQCSLSAVSDSDERKTFDFVFKLTDGRVIAIEVQFGNCGRLQADFAKFRTLHEEGKLALGIAVYFTRATAVTADSGLATYEAALRDAHRFGDMPVALVGLSREDTPVVDLREIQGLSFPQVLGGSGTNRLALHQFVAQALNEGTPMKGLALSDECKKVIFDHAQQYVEKLNTEYLDMVTRSVACTDPVLRTLLLGRIVDCARNSHFTAADRCEHIRASAKLTHTHELAALRAKEEQRQLRKKERASAKLVEKKAAAKRLRAENKMRALSGDAQAAPMPSTSQPAAQGALTAELAARASVAAPAAPVRRVIRVTKAQEAERLAARAPLAPPQPLRPPKSGGWSAMGAAFEQANLRRHG